MSTEEKGGVIHAALIQFAPKSAVCMEDVDYNTDRMLEWMDRAVTGFPGIDMVIFPECCFQGMSPSQFPKVGLTLDSEPVRRVMAKCRELEVWGVFNPWLKPDDGRFIENVGIIINDQGEIVHSYTKMNPFLPWEPTYPGNSFSICNGPKGSRIALLVCNDANFLDIWRQVSMSGANLVIHVSHWMAPYEYSHKLTNCAGAYFTKLPVLAVNGAGQDEAFVYCGNSLYVDQNGRIVAEAPLGIEWILEARVDPCAIENNVRQGITANWNWEACHRGASCPDMDGHGLGLDGYTMYK